MARPADHEQLWFSIMAMAQGLGLFEDCKHFVDMPLKTSWTSAERDWLAVQVALKNTADRQLHKCMVQEFVQKHFAEPGSDLETVLPLGWCEGPPAWMHQLPASALSEFACSVYACWKLLSRKVSPSVLEHPSHHTLLPLPHPFIMPGDRFRECYNWDSYWIIRGLLASQLTQAAEALVRNLLSLVDAHGFVPNGARTYYTNRSQPPLLASMVLDVWRAQQCSTDADGNSRSMQLLRDALPRLQKQHKYWTIGARQVVLQDAAGNLHSLSRYYAAWRTARPESYREDTSLLTHMAASGMLHTAHTSRNATAGDAAAASAAVVGTANSSTAAAGDVAAAVEQKYCELASAAESGWDFSARWALPDECPIPASSAPGSGSIPASSSSANSASSSPIHAGSSSSHSSSGTVHVDPILAATATTRVIPADLNGLLYRYEADSAEIAKLCGGNDCAQQFERLAAARLAAMDTLMWDDDAGCWRDLHIAHGGHLQHQHTNIVNDRLDSAMAAHASATVSAGCNSRVDGGSTSTGASSAWSGGDVTGLSIPQQPEPQMQPPGSIPPVHLPPCLLPRHYTRGAGVFFSNHVPLWCGCGGAPGSTRAVAAVKGLQCSGLIAACGVLTSDVSSGQQWDAPNAWPPLVHMAIQGLAQSGVAEGIELSRSIAHAWIRTNHVAWLSTGHMHEKYNAHAAGVHGKGGEYTPQIGFGWSNGVLLELLKSYGSSMHWPAS